MAITSTKTFRERITTDGKFDVLKYQQVCRERKEALKKGLMPIELPTDYTKLTGIQKYEVRCRYVEIQGGKCWFCKGDLKEKPPEKVANMKVKVANFPKGFFDNPIHLQHDHVTRLTEGAVHAHCNAVLWEYYGR